MNTPDASRHSLFTLMAHFLILVGLLCSQLIPAGAVFAQTDSRPVSADSARSTGVSPASFLNPDGTLNLDSHLAGSMDLNGWNVQMDPQRGPVFSPAKTDEINPEGLGAGPQWQAVGGGENSLSSAVYAVAVWDRYVFVGGAFTNADNIAEADYIAVWDGYSWSSLGYGAYINNSYTGSLNGPVYAIAIQKINNVARVIVGGAFTNIDNNGTVLSAADYVAIWDWQNWSAVGSGSGGNGSLNGIVYAITTSGTDVYVGGTFTNVNNKGSALAAADYVAKWDGTNWSALGSGSGGNGSLTEAVYALAASGSNLYVGGAFTNVNNKGIVLTAADYIAKWDGANWSAMGGTSTANGALNGQVLAILVNGTDVYVGGDFTNVSVGPFSILAADYIARWDGSAWSALGNNGASNGSLSGPVHALAMIGSDLFVGGSFSNVNNNGTVLGAADYIARWNTTGGWSAVEDNGAGNGAINGQVFALASDTFKPTSGILHIGGAFTQTNHGSTVLPAAGLVAQWDATNGWSGLSATVTKGSLNGRVRAIAVIGNDVYVGGEFTDVDNHGTILTAADYVAKWDGTNWSALSSDGAGNGSLNNSVWALAVIGSDLYVGGSFTNVNDNSSVLGAADYVAKWNGSNWSALKGNGGSDGSLNSSVYALAVSGTTLYVGGYFSNVSNGATILTAADRIAKWDGTNWSALGSGTSGDGAITSNSPVEAIAVSGTSVYVGGGFTDVNNKGTVLGAADYVAKWDSVSGNWSALGSGAGGNGALNDDVYALAVLGSDLYVGGTFKDVNNNGTVLGAADYIAKWDGSNWSALGSDGAGDGALDAEVYALVVSGTDLYVGGEFGSAYNGATQNTFAGHVAKWDGTTWSNLGHGYNTSSSINYYVYALAFRGADLFAGGWFRGISNNGAYIAAADYLAVYADPGIAPPTVVSITRAGQNPAYSTDRLYFTVTFSRPVTGVDKTDFVVTSTGTAAYDTSSGVFSSGSGTQYTVMFDMVSGIGTVRLDLIDDDTIIDSNGIPIGGVGKGNGNYASGEAYIVGVFPNYLPFIKR